MLNVYKFHTDPKTLVQYDEVFKYRDHIVDKILSRYLSELQAGKYPNVMEAFGLSKFQSKCNADGDLCGIYPLGLDRRDCAVRIRLYEGRSVSDFALDVILVYNNTRRGVCSDELTKDPIEQTYQLIKKTLDHLADKALADERD
jgi:hypothetical protein